MPTLVKDNVVSWLDGPSAVLAKHRASGSIGLEIKETPVLL